MNMVKFSISLLLFLASNNLSAASNSEEFISLEIEDVKKINISIDLLNKRGFKIDDFDEILLGSRGDFSSVTFNKLREPSFGGQLVPISWEVIFSNSDLSVVHTRTPP